MLCCSQVCYWVLDCNKTSGKLFRIRQHFKTSQQQCDLPVLSAIYKLTHLLFPPLLLTYACPCWLIKHGGHAEWGVPLLMRERLKDPHVFPVSLRASEEICCLLRSESLKLKCLCWQRTNGIFPSRKRCRIVLACSKCQGKNVSWSTPLMKHAHEIKACILLPMFRL